MVRAQLSASGQRCCNSVQSMVHLQLTGRNGFNTSVSQGPAYIAQLVNWALITNQTTIPSVLTLRRCSTMKIAKEKFSTRFKPVSLSQACPEESVTCPVYVSLHKTVQLPDSQYSVLDLV